MTRFITPSIFAVIVIFLTSALAAQHPLNQWLAWMPAPAGILVFALAFWATSRKVKNENIN